MSAPAIRVTGLGKSYRIDHEKPASYRTLRDSISALSARAVHRSQRVQETIWALQDVSFEVPRGEALGIIGRNGAGKSTLLKILSRITRPSTGRAEVTGRLGSLLEVGTGFHPELTGRENIYLNGAILGMTRIEIARRFDEIVAFAEVDRFLDTPVKRYSSGMYTRLAFAVAAHMDTDVLIVDEVLAVGDAEFQAKCLGKMNEVAGEGRTVIFVSHNMAAVAQLCTNALMLVDGRVQTQGPSQQVIASYMARANRAGRIEFEDPYDESKVASFGWAELRDAAGEICQDFSVGDDVTVAFGIRLRSDLPRVKLALSIRAADGTPLVHVVDDDSGFKLGNDHAVWTVLVRFADVRLYPGDYRITLWAANAANTEVLDEAADCLTFRIIDGGKLTMRTLPRHWGLLFWTPDWKAMNGGVGEGDRGRQTSVSISPTWGAR